MTDALMLAYKKELKKIRELALGFAEQYPEMASRLKLSAGNMEDPLVGRLLEGFAFLTAHIQDRMDQESQQWSRHLLDALYPHFHCPVPSMSIVQFHPDRSMDKLELIPRHTLIKSSAGVEGDCYFQTTYPVTILPVVIDEIKMFRRASQSVLFLRLKMLKAKVPWPKSLRFYIAPESEGLYEGLFKDLDCSSGSVTPVGFSDEESMLFPDNIGASCYRLLAEFSAFPRKFLFFDFEFSGDCAEPEQTIEFCFKHIHEDLEKGIHKNSLALHCTPVINLFEQIAEPIRLDNTEVEYRIIPDAQRKPEAVEVYQIQSVELFSDQSGPLKSYPGFGKKFLDLNEPSYFYWWTRRKPGWAMGLPQLLGSESFLSISSFGYERSPEERVIASVKALCTNRNLPVHLPLVKGEVVLSFWKSSFEAIDSINLLHPFTEPVYPNSEKLSDHQLFAHLKSNFLNSHDCLDSLKTILSLYQNGFWAHRLVSLTIKPLFRRYPLLQYESFCQGSEVCLEVDDSQLNQSLYLLGSVLSHFFFQTVGVNSFVHFILVGKQSGEVGRWMQNF